MKEILEFIPTGKENAVSMAELSSMIGVDNRTTRSMIYQLRRSGELVCSGDSGYYQPGNNQELFEWYRMAHSRAIGTLTTLKKARQMLKDAGIDPDGGNNGKSA